VPTAFSQARKFHFVQNKMGSPFNLILVSEDSAKATELAQASFSLIDSFSHIYSDYDSTSELSKLSLHAGNGYQNCSPALWDILLRSKQAFDNSLHAFDISIGPLSSIWRVHRKKQIFPDSLTIKGGLDLVGLDKILWDIPNHQISIPKKGMKLDLGGIAKGYVAQKIIDFLKDHGIDAALADAGGDIAISNALPGNEGWLVGVNIPETTDDLMKKKLSLANYAVATSGDAYQYIEHNGKKYSHIIDPRTGYGVIFQRNVTVIAKDGTDADWLATACSILSIREAKSICKKQNAELFISSIENGKIIVYQTRGFKNYWKK
jgi:thiamine biosynthesis lipoprotein